MERKEKIVVLGAGESGVGAAVLALKKGYDVFVSDGGHVKPKYREMLDVYGIEWEEGGHTKERILQAKEIIKSPGIPEDAPVVVEGKQAGIPIISEIEFAGRYTRAKMICITGPPPPASSFTSSRTQATRWVWPATSAAAWPCRWPKKRTTITM